MVAQDDKRVRRMTMVVQDDKETHNVMLNTVKHLICRLCPDASAVPQHDK
jgi:hypothetical protein